MKIIWQRLAAPAGPQEGLLTRVDGEQVCIQELARVCPEENSAACSTQPVPQHT